MFGLKLNLSILKTCCHEKKVVKKMLMIIKLTFEIPDHQLTQFSPVLHKYEYINNNSLKRRLDQR